MSNVTCWGCQQIARFYPEPVPMSAVAEIAGMTVGLCDRHWSWWVGYWMSSDSNSGCNAYLIRRDVDGTHVPIEVELSTCVSEECEHDGDCPSRVEVVCLTCNAAKQGTHNVSEWEGNVTPCPVFGSGAPPADAAALMSALSASREADD